MKMKAQTSQRTRGTSGRISDEILIIPLCNKRVLFFIWWSKLKPSQHWPFARQPALILSRLLHVVYLDGFACMHELFPVVFVVACADICDCGSLKALFAENQKVWTKTDFVVKSFCWIQHNLTKWLSSNCRWESKANRKWKQLFEGMTLT